MLVSYDLSLHSSDHQKVLQGHQNVGELRNEEMDAQAISTKLQGHQNVGELRQHHQDRTVRCLIAGSPECW